MIDNNVNTYQDFVSVSESYSDIFTACSAINWVWNNNKEVVIALLWFRQGSAPGWNGYLIIYYELLQSSLGCCHTQNYRKRDCNTEIRFDVEKSLCEQSLISVKGPNWLHLESSDIMSLSIFCDWFDGQCFRNESQDLLMFQSVSILVGPVMGACVGHAPVGR